MAKSSIILGFGTIFAAVAVGYLIHATPGQDLEPLVLGQEGKIPLDACLARGLSNKVIILENEYCSACKIVVPRIKEIEQEFNKEFIFLDLSKKEDAEQLEEFKIMPRYTPTVLINCDVYIGAYPKEKYKQLVGDFLGFQ